MCSQILSFLINEKCNNIATKAPSAYQEQPRTYKLSLTLTQGLHSTHGKPEGHAGGHGGMEDTVKHTGALTCCLLFGIYGSSVDTWNMSSKSLYVV